MPDRHNSAKMFKADIAAAGLVYRDDAGLVGVDFHALRHTFISNLARGGIHPKVAQALARRSTITLTMDRYSHTVVEEQVASLTHCRTCPRQAGKLFATGTDGGTGCQRNLASSLSVSGRFQTTRVDSGGQNPDNARVEQIPEKTEETPVFAGNSEIRRGARAADWAGLENRCGEMPTEGSNPSLSAYFAYLIFANH